MSQTETTDLEESLHEALDRDFAAVKPDEETPWTIEDESAASWAIRKIAKIDRDAQKALDLAEEQIAKVETWRDKELERIQGHRSFFEYHLAAYHRSRLIEDERVKTISLPDGTLKARKSPDNIAFADEERFFDQVLHAGEDRFIKVTKALDRKMVKEAVLKDGESLPGVSIVPGEVRFSVEVAS